MCAFVLQLVVKLAPISQPPSAVSPSPAPATPDLPMATVKTEDASLPPVAPKVRIRFVAPGNSTPAPPTPVALPAQSPQSDGDDVMVRPCA